MAEKELQKGYQEWTIEKSILNTGEYIIIK